MTQWMGGIQNGPAEFIASPAQELGKNRCTNEQRKVLSRAHLSAIAEVIKMVIRLAFKPQFGFEAVRKIESLGVAMIKGIENNHLRFCWNQRPAKLVLSQRLP